MRRRALRAPGQTPLQLLTSSDRLKIIFDDAFVIYPFDKTRYPMTDYWEAHGILFTLGLMLFPRITVFFFSGVVGGALFWIGFLIFPRIVVCVLAAYHYWETNPITVVLAFIWCFAGEGSEKGAVHKVSRHRRDA
jgi:hypothetical protein